MTARSAIRLAALALILGGCSQFAVHSDRDPAASFARRHTYGWLPVSEVEPADQRVLDPYIDARIRAAVDTELRAKGYVPAGAAAPDLLLNYRLTTERPADRNAGASFLGDEWHGWAGADAVYADSTEQGTLFLAAVDPATRRMIWIGAATARILPWISIEKRTKRVDDAVHNILARFPVG